MRELNIEEKAQRYDEAIKKVNDYYEGKTKLYSDVDKTLNYLFPELKESEERIRKDVVAAVEAYGDFTQGRKEEIYAWLEKQGECHISHDDEIMIEQLTEYFTTGHGLQNTNETVVEFLKGIKEKLEKQGDHVDFLSKIQVGDKVTRNEDGVLVNLSQLKRVAKKDEKQGEQSNSDVKDYNKKIHLEAE